MFSAVHPSQPFLEISRYAAPKKRLLTSEQHSSFLLWGNVELRDIPKEGCEGD